MLKKIFVTAICLLVSNLLLAQFVQLSPAVQPEMAWREGSVVLSYRNYFEIHNPGKSEPITLQVPPNTVDNRFAQDYFWIIQDDSSQQRLRICRSEDGRNWEYVASWYTTNKTVNKTEKQRFYLHPLSDDTFLLVAQGSANWFKVNGKPYPIVTAKINHKKELVVAHPVDLGLHEQLGWEKNGEFVFNEHYVWFLSGTVNRPFLTVGNKVFLAFRRFGAFVEVRPNGSIGKFFKIIPELDEKMASDPNGYDWAVLCAQPTRSDDILVLSRTSDGVTDGRKRFPRTYSIDMMKDKNLQESVYRADEAALRAYPLMDWWLLDPDSGKMHQASAPQNVPTMFTSVKEFRDFVFFINPKGNLIFPLLNRLNRNF